MLTPPPVDDAADARPTSRALTSSAPRPISAPARASDEDAGPVPGGDLVAGADGILRPAWASRSDITREWFDEEWNRPVRTESGLFELIAMLVFAGGLTWSAVLAKRADLRAAFDGFDPDRVAAYDAEDVRRLVADARIIRNESKITAVVTNAAAVVGLRASGGLVATVWGDADGRAVRGPADPVPLSEIDRSSDRSAALAAALAGAGFTRLGPVTTQSLLLSAGVVPVATARATPIECGATRTRV